MPYVIHKYRTEWKVCGKQTKIISTPSIKVLYLLRSHLLCKQTEVYGAANLFWAVIHHKTRIINLFNLSPILVQLYGPMAMASLNCVLLASSLIRILTAK